MSTIQIDTAHARDLVADALAEYLAARATTLLPSDEALLEAMSSNVTGWTHTTRLREFLEGVAL